MIDGKRVPFLYQLRFRFQLVCGRRLCRNIIQKGICIGIVQVVLHILQSSGDQLFIVRIAQNGVICLRLIIWKANDKPDVRGFPLPVGGRNVNRKQLSVKGGLAHVLPKRLGGLLQNLRIQCGELLHRGGMGFF